MLNYSVSHTTAWFKKHFHMTFSELLQRERILKATRLLKETDISISDIIKECGYENESFFRRKFKEVYSKTPLAYRKLYKNERKEK